MNNIKIYGYTGWYLVKPKIKVYIGEEFIGEVLYKDIFEYKIERDCILTFICGIRKTEIKVYKDKVNEVQLEFDRVTGQLNAKYKG